MDVIIIGIVALVLFALLVKGLNTKHCQFCEKAMRRDATVCPHCGREQAAEEEADATTD